MDHNTLVTLQSCHKPSIWVRSRNCSCLVTWFCYQLIAKPVNKTATVWWPDPLYDHQISYFINKQYDYLFAVSSPVGVLSGSQSLICLCWLQVSHLAVLVGITSCEIILALSNLLLISCCWQLRRLIAFWKTRAISLLLIPWLLVLPYHQQPWYWFVRSFSPMRTSTCDISVYNIKLKKGNQNAYFVHMITSGFDCHLIHTITCIKDLSISELLNIRSYSFCHFYPLNIHCEKPYSWKLKSHLG